MAFEEGQQLPATAYRLATKEGLENELYEYTKQVFTFFGLTLEFLTFFEVSVEYFGVSNRQFGYFVLISFRSYDGIPLV
jgi:hypothetical protein